MSRVGPNNRLLKTVRRVIHTHCETMVKRYFGIGRLPSTDGQDEARVNRVGEAGNLELEGMDLNPETNIFCWVTRSW